MVKPRPTVVSIGEVLWDVFPDESRFGGAPANVACHAAALGASAVMVSQVGHDQLGSQAIAALQERGVLTQHVGVSETWPTGTVLVELDAAGKPTFTIGENVAWDHLQWTDSLDLLATHTDAICFGTLAQRSDRARRVIDRLVSATPPGALRVLDVNLRPPFCDDSLIEHSIKLANVLKLSDDELDRVASACGLQGSESGLLLELTRRYKLQLIALTRGKQGATLYRENDRSDSTSVSVTVKDTVGAGDAFTASLIMGLLDGEDLDTINQHASQLAAYVCSQHGATPSLPVEFCKR